MGGAKAAPGNQGSYLSKREILDLNSCLTVSPAVVYAEEVVHGEYRAMYSKNYPSDADNNTHLLACVQYTFCSQSRRWMKNDLKDEIRPFLGNQKFNHLEQVGLECNKKMEALVS